MKAVAKLAAALTLALPLAAQARRLGPALFHGAVRRG